MIEKKIVERNFSKNVATYDKYANVQRGMAKKLIDLYVCKERPRKILEIGCGTGIFTELLISKFPDSEIDVLDISASMLKVSKDKFGEKVNKYICADAETYSENQKYDLIISNASFQWFKDINSSIGKLLSLLNMNGEIYFSIFAADTYYELRNAFSEYDSNYVFSQNFISKNDFDMNKYKIELLKDENVIQTFDSLLDFFRAVKGIGANSALKDKKVLTKNMLNKVEEIYLNKYGKINVTNHLLYLKVKK